MLNHAPLKAFNTKKRLRITFIAAAKNEIVQKSYVKHFVYAINFYFMNNVHIQQNCTACVWYQHARQSKGILNKKAGSCWHYMFLSIVKHGTHLVNGMWREKEDRHSPLADKFCLYLFPVATFILWNFQYPTHRLYSQDG